jgi:uncharacterized phage-associated protein
MVAASDVAKYLLSLVDDEKGQVISNLALQKLLYYCQGYYLAYTNGQRKLFEEDIVAWKYGPVVVSVYNEYKKHGNCALPTNELTAEIASRFTPQQKELIGSVFEFFSGYSAISLMEKTHSEFPWKTTDMSEVISTEKMYDFFKGKIAQ